MKYSLYLCIMGRGLLEFNCVVYQKNTEADKETEKYRDLGIELPPDEEQIQEKVVKYSFDVSRLVEVRETFIMFNGEWQDATIAMFVVTDKIMTETPPLLISYDEFKKKVNEHNQESS